MKAGKYFCGDPCYIIGEPQWSEVCSKIIENDEFELDGHEMFMAGTSYGDGNYKDQFGNEYGVDSGTLGCVPLALCKRKDLIFSDIFDVPQTVKNSDGYTLGYVFNFDEDFECMEYGGKFDFGGKVQIDTSDEDLNDEECSCCT